MKNKLHYISLGIFLLVFNSCRVKEKLVDSDYNVCVYKIFRDIDRKLMLGAFDATYLLGYHADTMLQDSKNEPNERVLGMMSDLRTTHDSFYEEVVERSRVGSYVLDRSNKIVSHRFNFLKRVITIYDEKRDNNNLKKYQLIDSTKALIIECNKHELLVLAFDTTRMSDTQLRNNATLECIERDSAKNREILSVAIHTKDMIKKK